MTRAALVAVVTVVVLGSLVAVGRHERASQTADELRGIARVRAAVADLASPTRYRWSPAYSCLDYGLGGNPLALELCFDPTGRVLEASDRRTSDVRVYSLRFDSDAATTQLGPERLSALRHLQRRAARQIWAIGRSDVNQCRHRVVGRVHLPVARAATTCSDAAERDGNLAALAADDGLATVADAVRQLVEIEASYVVAAERFGRDRDREALVARVAELTSRVDALDRKVQRASR